MGKGLKEEFGLSVATNLILLSMFEVWYGIVREHLVGCSVHKKFCHQILDHEVSNYFGLSEFSFCVCPVWTIFSLFLFVPLKPFMQFSQQLPVMNVTCLSECDAMDV